MRALGAWALVALLAWPAAAQKVAGAGASLSFFGEALTVRYTIPGGPAAKAGLRVGDVLLEADGQPLLPPIESAVERIKGPAGSRLRLTLRRHGEPKPLELTLTRELFQPPTSGWRALLLDQAEFWAGKGVPHAQYELGLLFAEGIGGVPPDPERAALWHRRAAQAGYAPAIAKLAGGPDAAAAPSALPSSSQPPAAVPAGPPPSRELDGQILP